MTKKISSKSIYVNKESNELYYSLKNVIKIILQFNIMISKYFQSIKYILDIC